MSKTSTMRARYLGTALTLFAVCAHADEPESVDRRTTVGHEVRVGNHAAWSANCTATIPPTVKVIEPPSHGHVDLREGDFTVNRLRIGASPCNGVMMHGRLVYYVPDPGFIGDDSLSYDLRTRTGSYPFRINVKVKVEEAAAASSPASRSSAPPA